VNNSRAESEGLSFVVEPKIDGLSLAIQYDANGNLVRAGTRGDGEQGEDVTANARHVDGIVENIQSHNVISGNPINGAFEVRGEVYIRKNDLPLLNVKRLESNKTAFSTARNAAAGSLRKPGDEYFLQHSIWSHAQGYVNMQL
jgi:DNA ligase (NAD+)